MQGERLGKIGSNGLVKVKTIYSGEGECIDNMQYLDSLHQSCIIVIEELSCGLSI